MLYSAKTVTFGHSRSCDEVTLVRPQVNSPVRTAGPVMFHNDCNLFLNAYINHNVHAKHSKKIEFYIVPLAYSVFFYVHVVLTPTKMKKTYHINSMCVNTGNNMTPIISIWGFFQSSRAAYSYVLMVGSWRISNQSEILWLSLLPARIKMKV